MPSQDRFSYDSRRQADDKTETHRDLCRGVTLRFQLVLCRHLTKHMQPQGDGEPCDAPLTETAGCDDRDTLQWHLDCHSESLMGRVQLPSDSLA